jgi:hypothetical protein
MGSRSLAFQSLFHLRMILSEKCFWDRATGGFEILRVSRKRTAKSAALAYDGEIMHPE